MTVQPVQQTGHEAQPPPSLLEKAALVLGAFQGSTPRLTLTEVVHRSGLPRSSVHRILDQLVQLRWLDRDGRDYRLGMRMLELGAMASHHNRLRRAALPHLHELHEKVGHVVHLAVIDGPEVVYLERIGGAADCSVPSRTGGRQPAYCTGTGKAILAFGDEALVAEVLRSGLRPRTPYTITRPRAFREELARIRERGVAFDREEAFRGVACVAAPLRGSGRAIASISVCGNGVHRELERMAPAVLGTARAVWSALYGPGRAAAARSGSRPGARAAGAARAAGNGSDAGAAAMAPAQMDTMMSWLRFAEWM
ncbi:IclR family transcriptional regulator [Streptomyces sp. TRM S81-3]|uniref:IclR family transcriptional regulator n=1 Tax=Streptomyces griseicoloratus TaxID=2752516 RepID=A0A926L176_9ACTN|nr:IclR family transcriptional regulator [Streptomyces griseicoloratus]MBD0418641.1 IclR family transcriptional regulator [Streptomyces griseicoloratus]